MASLFETIIHGKAEINGAEDLNYIIGTILDNDETLEILHQLTLSNSAPIVYQASRVLSQALIHLYNSGEKSSSTSPGKNANEYISLSLESKNNA